MNSAIYRQSTRRRLLAAGVFTLLALLPPALQAFGQEFYISFAARVLIFALVATSLNFVVGFGGGLSSSEQQCLTQMADAGGKPDMTPLKYYKADSADELNKALSSIVEVVIGGEVGIDLLHAALDELVDLGLGLPGAQDIRLRNLGDPILGPEHHPPAA